MNFSRRQAAKVSAAGLVLAGIGGATYWMDASDAHKAGASFSTLTQVEADWISSLGGAIAPPSRMAGLAHYVDHHLTVPQSESLLALRYLDITVPYLDFYRTSLSSLAAKFGRKPPGEGDTRWDEILATLGSSSLTPWSGPPPPQFLFAVRLDAIDIAYGTRAGFSRLGVDYMPHIEPRSDW